MNPVAVASNQHPLFWCCARGPRFRTCQQCGLRGRRCPGSHSGIWGVFGGSEAGHGPYPTTGWKVHAPRHAAPPRPPAARQGALCNVDVCTLLFWRGRRLPWLSFGDVGGLRGIRGWTWSISNHRLEIIRPRTRCTPQAARLQPGCSCKRSGLILFWGGRGGCPGSHSKMLGVFE